MAAREVDWDLNAVVRSFAGTNRTSTSSSSVNSDDPLQFFTSLPPVDVGNGSQSQTSVSFVFPELFKPRSNGFDELQQLLRPFFIASDSNNGSNSSYGRQMQKQQPVGCEMNVSVSPQKMIRSPPPSSKVVFSGNVFRGGNQPSPVQSQIPRSRKRKNQVKKSVCHVTGENLSSDLWAWRKYGQKPIKGSPFPRNYYRCSSSKGCTARKQVEKSTTDQNVFIVTYTGEHSHPRPTHRNSLAGSTRNKLTNALKPAVDATLETTSAGIEDFKPPLPAVSGLSPTTPLTAPVTSEEPVLSMDDMDEDGVEEDDDLLIPNVMSEDLFILGVSPYPSGDDFPFNHN